MLKKGKNFIPTVFIKPVFKHVPGCINDIIIDIKTFGYTIYN